MLNYFVLLKNLKRHFSKYNCAGILLSLLFFRNKVCIPSMKMVIFLRKGSKDHETFDEIFRDNLYGTPLPFAVTRIIDAGANTGIASIFFKMKYKEAKIAAIEIENSNVVMLRKNLLHRDFIIYQKALYNKKSFFKVDDPYHATNSFIIKEVTENEKYDIESVTIDEILKDQNWDMVDILKVDIEGAEKVLFGSNYQSWLAKIRVVMIETHDRMVPGCSCTVIKAMKEFNFALFTTAQGTLVFCNQEVMGLYGL